MHRHCVGATFVYWYATIFHSPFRFAHTRVMRPSNVCGFPLNVPLPVTCTVETTRTQGALLAARRRVCAPDGRCDPRLAFVAVRIRRQFFFRARRPVRAEPSSGDGFDMLEDPKDSALSPNSLSTGG